VSSLARRGFVGMSRRTVASPVVGDNDLAPIGRKLLESIEDAPIVHGPRSPGPASGIRANGPLFSAPLSRR